MRVAFIDTTLMQPPTGGCQTFLVDLGVGLARSGWEVHVVTEEGPETSAAERLAAGGAALEPSLWTRRHLPEERAARLSVWARHKGLQAYVVSLSADAGWLALPLLGPTVGTLAIVHSDGPTFYNPLAHYAAFVDRAVGVSEQTYRRIVSHCGIPPVRARRIPYGVRRLSPDEARTRWEATAHASLRVAYVGRLVQGQKRVLDLAPLAAELARRGIPFEMHVIGTGEAAGRLTGEIEAAGLSGLVRFWGWLSPAEVSRRLLELDAVVLLSEVEGLPLALLEAMGHAAVPVVTRTRSGNSEVVRSGENGYLVPIGDIPAFADRLEALARDPGLLARLRQAAWETSGQYSLERMTAEYVRCIGETVSADEARAPRPASSLPVMPSCRSRYPLWLRRMKWRLLGPRRVGKP